MIPITVDTRSTTRLSKAEWVKASNGAWTDAAAFWHERLLGKHFTTAAVSEYGYQPRKRRYQIVKAKAKGHQRPLVWSGETERQVKRRREVKTVRARGDKTGAAVVRLQTPRYVTRPWRGRPPLPLEVARVSERDAAELGRVIEQTVVQALNEPAPPHRAGQE